MPSQQCACALQISQTTRNHPRPQTLAFLFWGTRELHQGTILYGLLVQLCLCAHQTNESHFSKKRKHVLILPSQCDVGQFSANTSPHQLRWGDCEDQGLLSYVRNAVRQQLALIHTLDGSVSSCPCHTHVYVCVRACAESPQVLNVCIHHKKLNSIKWSLLEGTKSFEGKLKLNSCHVSVHGVRSITGDLANGGRCQ